VVNDSSCYITSAKLRTLPESIRSLQTKLETPSLYLPIKVSAVNDHEIRQLEDIVPADAATLDGITAQVTNQKLTLDVDSLFHVHQTSLQLKQHTQWSMILATSITVALFWDCPVSSSTLISINREATHYVLPRTQILTHENPVLPRSTLNEIQTKKAMTTLNYKPSSQHIL
jgi:uncharacterized protein YqiB (DUF1249 family)